MRSRSAGAIGQAPTRMWGVISPQVSDQVHMVNIRIPEDPARRPPAPLPGPVREGPASPPAKARPPVARKEPERKPAAEPPTEGLLTPEELAALLQEED